MKEKDHKKQSRVSFEKGQQSDSQRYYEMEEEEVTWFLSRAKKKKCSGTQSAMCMLSFLLSEVVE